MWLSPLCLCRCSPKGDVGQTRVVIQIVPASNVAMTTHEPDFDVLPHLLRATIRPRDSVRFRVR
jgi:hypothetical protein